MNEDYIFKMPHTVLYSETDARGLLSLPAFFSLFQEAALLQAEQLNFGETYCNEKGLMWVLSRLLLDIRTFPCHRDKVRLKTWPKKPQGPFATRDFIIESEQGEPQARATSAWLLLDTSTMRPVRPQPLFAPYPLDELGAALDEPASKVTAEEIDCSKEIGVTARYSDLDQNMHVNNTRYVRWFLDCFAPEEVTPDGNLRFLINYQKAASYNDQVTLCRYDGEKYSSVRGYLADDSETFAARIWLHK